jgi:hypothetical protein
MITPALQHALLNTEEPHQSHCCYFDVNGEAVRVSAPDSETIASLRAFFYPYVSSLDKSHRSYDLTTIADPELYAFIKSNLPATADATLSTTLQHNFEYELKCFTSASGEIRIIEDEPLKLIYIVFGRKRQTKVVATDGSRIRTGLLRIIRGAWVLGHDGLIVHGCVLAKQERGILISGEKYAGKTTTLFNLCLRKGYDIVANDRLLLEGSTSGAQLTARGIPTVVKLRENTVKPFPELQHLLEAPLFSVSDLARELKVDVKREARISAIAFLFYHPDSDQPAFRELAADEAHEILLSHLFPRSEYDWVRLIGIGNAARGRIEHSGNKVLSRTQYFRLTCNETHLEDVAGLLDRWCQNSKSS